MKAKTKTVMVAAVLLAGMTAGSVWAEAAAGRVSNGRCVNLGAYGNTSEAMTSPGGTMLFVR